MDTLDLHDAADFLKMHWQTLRAKARSGEIPGAKLGKRWVFLKEDLVSYIRAHYADQRPRSQGQQIAVGTRCCTSDQTRASGVANSQHQTETYYKNLQKQ
mgnify:CR=1 FL=1